MNRILRISALLSAVALAGSLPATVCGQEKVNAKPGESCSTFNRGCNTWCSNQGSNWQSDCLQTCKTQQSVCLSNGTWPLEKGTKLVTGLAQQ